MDTLDSVETSWKNYNQTRQVKETCRHGMSWTPAFTWFYSEPTTIMQYLESSLIWNPIVFSCRFRTPQDIRKAFLDAGVDVESPLPITTTCGSGVTAAVLTFALELVGRKADQSPVYDGAWAEWGAREDLPRATGEDLD